MSVFSRFRILCVYALIAIPAASLAECLDYEPATVSLRGVLESRTFPGPPNYESVAAGDEAEQGFYLVPSEPVCTHGLPGNETAYKQENVALVQLVLDRRDYETLRPHLGGAINVRGKLYARHTGHHHAPLLLKFEDFIPIAPASDGARSPEDAARTFYAWVLAHVSAPPSPLPAEIEAILSGRLSDLLGKTVKMGVACLAAAEKDSKPHILEGDLFVGNYEGASEAAYGETDRRGNAAFINVRLFHVDPRFPRAHPHRVVAWEDRLELSLVGSRWFIDDVVFPDGQSLIEVLNGYVTEGAELCGQRSARRAGLE